MNHATISAINTLLARPKYEDSVPDEYNLNFCDGKPRDEFVSPEPNNVFTSWDAWHITQEKEDPDKLATDSLKNVDCPICRVAIDAALDGVDYRKLK